MSHVTGLVLCFSMIEDYIEQTDGSDKFPIIDEINSWLKDNNRMPLVRVDEQIRCGKHPQMHVFGGGYNYFPDEEFLELYHSLNWEEKEEVFLIFNPEEGPMRVIQPK